MPTAIDNVQKAVETEPIVAPLAYPRVTDADVGGYPGVRLSGCALGLGLAFAFIALGFFPLVSNSSAVIIVAIALVFASTTAGVSRYEYHNAVVEYEQRLRAEAIRREEAARNEAEAVTAELRRELREIPAAALQAKLDYDNALNSLSRAQNEFASKAYSSFWDLVLSCQEQLQSSSNMMMDTAKRIRKYHEQLRGRTHTFPQTPIISSELPAIDHAARELSKLARLGETDYQFATILEHKKTRGVLVSGFSSVTSAIDDLGMRLEGALDAVRNELTIAQEQQAATAACLQISVDSIAADAATSADTDRRVSAVIDKYRLLDE